MFRQVGKQHSKVEADLLGWVVEALCELYVIDLAIMVTVTAHEEEVNLLSRQRKIEERKGLISELRWHKINFFIQMPSLN